MEVDELRGCIEEGLAGKDWTPLIELLFEDASFAHRDGSVAGYEPLDAHIIDEFVRLLANERFLVSGPSLKLFIFIEGEWLRIPYMLRPSLLEAVTSSFRSVADPASQLAIAELLGEYFVDIGGVDALIRLRQSLPPVRTVMVPDGLRKAVVNASDPQLRRRAYKELESLANDKYAPVQEEAEDALGWLRSRGLP